MAAVPVEIVRAALREQVSGFVTKEIGDYLSVTVDGLERGLPRGAATEIAGEPCSGRTSLLHSILAVATRQGEFCALVDASDSFDPASAAEAGVLLPRLLWVRCSGNALHALKATDLLAHAGGFGVVVFDLGDVPSAVARRISLTSWFRLRRAIEHTPTVLVVITRERQLRQCAALVVDLVVESRKANYVRMHYR